VDTKPSKRNDKSKSTRFGARVPSDGDKKASLAPGRNCSKTSIHVLISGAYFCDTDTPESTVQFLQYLEHGIGLEVGVWNWTSGGFGRARWDFPSPKGSSFTGLSCHQKGYGLGKVVES
jgi:hypothetical protein